MKITCSQMDVLIAFYIEGDLSKNLKQHVEEHLKNCLTCQTKFEIIKSMVKELKNQRIYDEKLTTSEKYETKVLENSPRYGIFKTNLSAYIDNELNSEENLKIKKYAIQNKKARKELEDSYKIRKLMRESFEKTKNESKIDFAKSTIKQLEKRYEESMPKYLILKWILLFISGTIITTSFILYFIGI